MQGVSGTIGKELVLRYRMGQQEIYTKPAKPKGPRSPAQIARQNKFREAQSYASRQMKDPAMKAAYQKKTKAGQYAYHVALADALNAPEILGVNLNGYQGEAGKEIEVQARDDFAVVRVSVEIKTPDGQVIESGTAQYKGGMKWVYVTQQNYGNWQEGNLRVAAEDNPGNRAEANMRLAADG